MKKSIASCFVFIYCVSVYATEYDYNRAVYEMLPKPVSFNSTTDLLSRAEFIAINTWLKTDANPAMLIAASLSQCSIPYSKSATFRIDFAKAISNEFTEHALNSYFDNSMRERIIGALYVEVVNQLSNDCTVPEATNSVKAQYKGLVSFYADFETSLTQLDNVISIARSRATVKEKVSSILVKLDETQRTKLTTSLRQSFESISQVDTKLIDEQVLLKVSRSVLDSPIAEDLPPEVKGAYKNLASVAQIKETYKDLERIINDDKPLGESIEAIKQAVEGRIGENEERWLNVSSIVAKHSYGTIDNAQAIEGVVAIFKHDMDSDLVTAIDTGNEIYKALGKSDFDFTNIDTDSVVSLTPAVTSLAKVAFDVKPGSDEDKALDVVMNVGLAYFTGNPAAALGAISSLTSSNGPSPEQMRHQAIMAQLNIINKKLDTVLDNQAKMMESLNRIEREIIGVKDELVLIRQNISEAKIDILDGIGKLKVAIRRNSERYKKTNDCTQQYEVLAFNNKVTEKRHFKFQIQTGDALDEGLHKIDFISVESEEWFDACYKVVTEIRSLTNEKDNGSSGLEDSLSIAKYDAKAGATDTTTQAFKDIVTTLSSTIACDQFNSSQVCKRRKKFITDPFGIQQDKPDTNYLTLAERDSINIIQGKAYHRFETSKLTVFEQNSYLSNTDFKNINKIRLLTSQKNLTNVLHPIDLNQLTHIALDLREYVDVNPVSNKDYKLDVINKLLVDLELFLRLAILQQETLSGAAYTKTLYRLLETNRITKSDFNHKLMVDFPELSRRVLIRACRLNQMRGHAPCLDSLKNMAITGQPVDLTNQLEIPSSIKKIQFVGSTASMEVLDTKITFGLPTITELKEIPRPIATNSIHLRATLAALELIIN